jgi:GTP-binding protein
MRLRNIAIIAHVDHGKTTLVDQMFRHAGTFRANQKVAERVLDSNDQERERGITILAKNTSIDYAGTRINIIDTPGHADFGGQVERTLSMADAALLLVDAYEGPMPQTRFVLRKAFEAGLKVLVMINKIDRPDQRSEQVLDEVFDLFVELGAHDEQLDFPVVYGSGREGYAVKDPGDAPVDLEPLFSMILQHVPSPPSDDGGPLQFQAATIEHDDFVGRLGIGRVHRGVLRPGDRVVICHETRDLGEGGRAAVFAVKQVQRFEGLARVPCGEVRSGDIAVVGGIDELRVGDTLCDPEHPDPLPAIALEEPTISMVFQVSNSPFAGREGRYVTSRQILARLELAAQRDVALSVLPTDSPDSYEVKGRGVMHLGVLIESMRREGFEFSVGKPHVIIKEVGGVLCEPYERAAVESPEACAGKIIEFLGRRRGEMTHLEPLGAHLRMEFVAPSRGLLGARTAIMTLSQGEAIFSHVFDSWRPDQGRIPRRNNGVLISDRDGQAVPYALFSLTDRGEFFVHPGDPVYEGMIVGANNKDKDLSVNVCREKKLTNMRAAGRDENVKLSPPRVMSLEEALEYVEDDELLEVTPSVLRLRKRILKEHERKKEKRRSAEVS